MSNNLNISTENISTKNRSTESASVNPINTVPSYPLMTIFIATLGTLLEWAEYTFYGYLAFKMSVLFFPEGNHNLNLLKTYGIFAIGYLVRPLGAIVFGCIGDQYGRKTALMSAVLLMGLSTLGIGCLPTYASIGLLAPIGLLLLRVLQGFAISGEYNGAGIFLIEHMNKKNPCFGGACISASACAGMVVGGIAAYLVSLPFAPEWAWRVPFFLGSISCFLSSYARRRITETPAFLSAQQSKSQLPLMQVLRYHKYSFIYVIMLAAFMSIFIYIGNIYIVTFLKEVVGLPTHHATFFAIVGEGCAALLIPFMGYWADRTHKATEQFKCGLVLAIFSAPLIFTLCYTAHYMCITMAMLLFGLTNAIASGPVLKLVYDRFPTNIRYTGVSVAWSIAAALFGGSAPMVAHYLASSLGFWLGPSLYMSFAALVTFLFLQEPKLKCDTKEAQTA